MAPQNDMTARTPRRTIRLADEVWEAGHAKAETEGVTLTEVLRRLLDGYLLDQGLEGYGYEYRAIPNDQSLTGAEREELTVLGITGHYADIRRLYPHKHWLLEERAVSDYRPAQRRRVRPSRHTHTEPTESAPAVHRRSPGG